MLIRKSFFQKVFYFSITHPLDSHFIFKQTLPCTVSAVSVVSVLLYFSLLDLLSTPINLSCISSFVSMNRFNLLSALLRVIGLIWCNRFNRESCTDGIFPFLKYSCKHINISFSFSANCLSDHLPSCHHHISNITTVFK